MELEEKLKNVVFGVKNRLSEGEMESRAYAQFLDRLLAENELAVDADEIAADRARREISSHLHVRYHKGFQNTYQALGVISDYAKKDLDAYQNLMSDIAAHLEPLVKGKELEFSEVRTMIAEYISNSGCGYQHPSELLQLDLPEKLHINYKKRQKMFGNYAEDEFKAALEKTV